jgi:signal transduction histidine kinase
MHEPGTASDDALPQPRRWAYVWGTLSFALLAVSSGLCLADAAVPWQRKITAVGLAAAWGAWYWLFVMRPRAWRELLAVRVVSFVLSAAIAALLSWIHTGFVLLLFAYYGISYGALPLPWAIPVTVVASLALAARFSDLGRGRLRRDSLLMLAGFLGMAFLGALLALFVGSIMKQSRERKRMIDELQAAHEELARSERAAGVLEERQRLAGEIHDTLAQGFTSIILQLQAAREELEGNPKEARLRIDRALASAHGNLDEARRVLWALRPDLAGGEPFRDAVKRVLRSWGETSGIETALAETGTVLPLHLETRLVLVRSLQEALANVRRHANARTVNVTLSYMDGELVMDVQDDGAGFDTAARGPGFGLRAMRERVEKLGGRLDVESTPGEGTTLAVQVPLAGRGREGEAT